MKLDFDLEQIVATEFGLGEHVGASMQFGTIPVDNSVHAVLLDVVKATLRNGGRNFEVDTVVLPYFDPADKHASEEYLVLPIDHELAKPLAEFHNADRLLTSPAQLELFQRSFCYFVRLTDSGNRRLTALRRASQFKGTLGRQNRLLALLGDTLRTVNEPLFQLNADFDVLIDSQFIHIVHPTSFRVLGQIDEAIAEAMPRNVERIRASLPDVGWSSIQEYAASHPRAASLLSSIRTRGYAENLSRTALVDLCKRTHVVVDDSQDEILVSEDQVLAFLEVVDRRRYDISLVTDSPEQYRASSRERLAQKAK